MSSRKNLVTLIVIVLLMQVVTPIFNCEVIAATSYTNTLTSGDLIRIYNSKTGFDFTVTSKTTIDEVIEKYGEPKIKTDSCFGGHSYTFYTDDKYSNYLYLETVANDEYIISYGTVWNQYFIYRSGYDEAFPFTDNSLLQGMILEYDAKVKGGIYYNRNKYIGGSVTNTVNAFEETYKGNPTHYLKSIAEHAVTMYNAICTINGYKCNLKFDEDIFYINEQLKQNGSSIWNYASDLGKTPYREAIGGRTQEINSRNYYLISPILMANMFYQYGTNRKDMDNKCKYGIFDYDVENKYFRSYVISEDMFKIWDDVALTSEENTKLNNAQNYYKTAMNLFDSQRDNIFKNKPVDDVAGNLYAGELTDKMKEGIVAYYNAIRAGSGLSTVTQNASAFKQAQSMAVLQSYRWHQLQLDISHSPDKPDGVSTDFYNTALGWGTVSLSENISRNMYAASVEGVIDHIKVFMDDSNEKPFNLSHRTSLLIPSNSEIGFGIADNIGTMEIAHSSSTTKSSDMVAWPANGVTLLENLENKQFRWSAQFRERYQVTNSTTVSVKCIQTGENWLWDSPKNDGIKYYSRDYNTGASEYRNRVIFEEASLVPQPGFVYEITINNILDTNTNKTTSYKYRSIFEYGDNAKYGSTISKLSIDSKDLNKVSGQNNTYYVPVGQETKLDAVLDDDVLNKKVTWSISNNKANITQNGTVFIGEDVSEPIKVTLTHDVSGKMDTIYLKTFQPNKIKLSEGKIDVKVGETKELSISEIASEVGNVSSIEWMVAKESNSSKEYSFDDSEIKKYLEITKIDDKKISIKGVNGSVGDNSFKIIVKVKGTSGTYKGESGVTVTVPLKSIGISFNNASNRGQKITYNPPGNYETSVNMEDFDEINHTDIIRYRAECRPTNTTVEQGVTWEILNNNGVLTACDEPGAFKMNKPGKTMIKATSTADPSISATLEITITSKTIPMYDLGDVNADGKINVIDCTAILKHIKGTKALTDDEQSRADINGDNKINVIDCTAILKHIKGTKLIK